MVEVAILGRSPETSCPSLGQERTAVEIASDGWLISTQAEVVHQGVRPPRQALDLRQGVGRAEPRLARAAAAAGRRRGGCLQSWRIRFSISSSRQSPREEGRVPRERRAVLQAAPPGDEELRGRRGSANVAGVRARDETEALGRDQGDDEARFSVTPSMNMMQLMDIGLNHYVLTQRQFP